MSRSWYVENRPQLIDEIDEEKVRVAILSFIKNGKFPHALLFAGPKGTGKTTTARIIAKVLNCTSPLRGSAQALGEPCNKCSICKEITNGSSMCVIEVDAASHRGIDDVRALRETVRLMPAGGRTKVYIIDEAHMLTTEAANALLKTLEEPPENVVFILATTDAQKIPDTIKSRATLIQFSRANKKELERSLNRVIKREKLDVNKEAQDFIVKSSDGSFRDATKILEQLVSRGKITKESINSFSANGIDDAPAFLDLLSGKDTKVIIGEIEKLSESGVNIRQFTIQLIEILHRQLLAKVGVSELELELTFQLNEIKELINLLSSAAEEMKSSPIPEIPLELVVMGWCGDVVIDGSQTIRLSRNSVPVEKEKLEVGSGKEGVSKSNTQASLISDDIWKQLLNKVKNQNFSLEALLKSARPLSFDGRDVTLSVFYKFHKDKLEEETHRRILEQILCELLGAQAVRVFFVLGEKPKTVIADDSVIISEAKENSEGEDITKMAEEIFGVEVHD